MNKCSLCKKNILNNAKREMPVCKLHTNKFYPVCKGVDIFKIPAVHNPQQTYEICCNEDPTTIKYEDDFKSRRYERNCFCTSFIS